jgi:hypothetical protein
MNQKDRATLRTIVKRRFEKLHQSLQQRERELEIVVRDNIMAETNGKARDLNVRWQAIRKEAATLVAQAEELSDEAAAAGLTFGERPLRFTANSKGVEPRNLYKLVNNEVARLRAESGLGKLHLEELEEQLIVDLLMGDLESDDAKEFLTKIPDANTLLPLPERKSLPESV